MSHYTRAKQDAKEMVENTLSDRISKYTHSKKAAVVKANQIGELVFDICVHIQFNQYMQ